MRLDSASTTTDGGLLYWTRRAMAYARYVAMKVATLTAGAIYGQPIMSADLGGLRKGRNARLQRPVYPGRIALVAHVYYS
jgi:hypothetical protein